MSTITGTGHAFRETSLDRALLRAAAAVDAFVVARIARRERSVARTRAQERAVALRRSAESLGALGVMPR
ncbi:hypothetical protein [Microbacterium thalassium]|uniref:Uncharacterized protein n=1 Tax=Microbacterium thalassium TaxID=362649 RepID=A0A7X0FR22_9MICO|nr:hypothetical protein [Microbacterium thalassium]MBB6392046.1 hypothetical protein [Microbacterium thalassium]